MYLVFCINPVFLEGILNTYFSSFMPIVFRYYLKSCKNE